MISEIQAALRGDLRRDVVAAAARQPTFARAVDELRKRMFTHVWRGGGVTLDVRDAVAKLDQLTRRDGFHVLHDWDGKADAVRPNPIVVEVLDFVRERRGSEPPDQLALAILLDYYFMFLLALLAMRAWDRGDAGRNLDEVSGLLRDLQGPNGSGQRFADDAETLMLIATSHYEPDDGAYDRLLVKVRPLPRVNRVAIAIGHAHAMGGHLRFAYEITTARSLPGTRADNVADYPWLSFSLTVLLEELDRLSVADANAFDRDRIVEALVDGLVPDPAAFASEVGARGPALVEAFARFRPLDRHYSPLSFYYAFSHNLIKGAVVDALLLGETWDVTLNDLFTGLAQDDARNNRKIRLAQTLERYARLHPDNIGGRLAPMVVYDPAAGRRSFAAAMRVLSSGSGLQ